MKALFVIEKKLLSNLCHEATEAGQVAVGTKEGCGWTMLTNMETPETVPVVFDSDEATIESLKIHDGFCFLEDLKPQLDTKPTSKAEVKAIKDFLKAKSKISTAKVNAISDSETDRRKIARAVLKEHGVSDQLLSQLNL